MKNYPEVTNESNVHKRSYIDKNSKYKVLIPSIATGSGVIGAGLGLSLGSMAPSIGKLPGEKIPLKTVLKSAGKGGLGGLIGGTAVGLGLGTWAAVHNNNMNRKRYLDPNNKATKISIDPDKYYLVKVGTLGNQIMKVYNSNQKDIAYQDKEKFGGKVLKGSTVLVQANGRYQSI